MNLPRQLVDLMQSVRSRGCCVKPLPAAKRERWRDGPEVLVLRCPRCKKELAVVVPTLPLRSAA